MTTTSQDTIHLIVEKVRQSTPGWEPGMHGFYAVLDGGECLAMYFDLRGARAQIAARLGFDVELIKADRQAGGAQRWTVKHAS